MNKQVERWDIFEVQVTGPQTGNPFTEQSLKGVFSGKNETVTVDGFYDGGGVYKLRFMPSFVGEYRYTTAGSFPAASTCGVFTVTPPRGEQPRPCAGEKYPPFCL